MKKRERMILRVIALPLAILLAMMIIVICWTPTNNEIILTRKINNQLNATVQSAKSGGLPDKMADAETMLETLTAPTTNAVTNTDSSTADGATQIDRSNRIEINLAACQLNYIENDRVVKTFQIAVAAPQHAMPITPYQASHLIWNPRWTPPPSPWARGESPKGPGAPGNPLGPMKIRIGGPYLIHGGGDKSVGRAVSHGCIRMRNEDVLELAKLIINTRKMSVTDEQFANYVKNRHREAGIKIDPILPVEVKYETIVVNNKQIEIYPDVYKRGTNNLPQLKKALINAGLDYEKLTAADQDSLSALIKGVKKYQSFELGNNNSATSTPEIANNHVTDDVR